MLHFWREGFAGQNKDTFRPPVRQYPAIDAVGFKIDNLDIERAFNPIRQTLAANSDILPALATAIERLLFLVPLLVSRLGFNSRNSSKPPSPDPARPRSRNRGQSIHISPVEVG